MNPTLSGSKAHTQHNQMIMSPKNQMGWLVKPYALIAKHSGDSLCFPLQVYIMTAHYI